MPTAVETGKTHPLESYLSGLHRQHAACRDGAVASDIPELTKADPTWLGIALATGDGHVYEVGDGSCRRAGGVLLAVARKLRSFDWRPA